MKKLFTTMIMLAIFLFALSTGVQAYTMTFTGETATPTQVDAGDTFNVVVTVDEQTVLANGQLFYDSSLFTFVSANQTNMSSNDVESALENNRIVKWMYTDLSANTINDDYESGTGTKTFVFTFQAANVTEEKTGRFILEDFVVTTADDKSYDNHPIYTIDNANSNAEEGKILGNDYFDVTIKPKSTPDNNWSLSPSGEVSIKKGETKQITVNGDVTLEWTSSDTTVATVDQTGKITAVGKGTAYITATKNGGANDGVNAQRIRVIVTEGDKEEDKIKFEPSEDFTLEKGKTNQIKITGAEGTVTWKSSDEKVATVDKDGKVTAVGAGTAIITATDSEGNTKSIVVTVKDNSKKDGNNTIKDRNNTSLPGKKDNTLTPDEQLPKTGGDFGKFLVLSLTAIILAAALVFKSKAKKLNKLFVIIPLVAIISVSGMVNAGKLVDNDSMKAGVYAAGELVEGSAVIAVSPSTQYTTLNKLTPEMIETIILEDIIEIKDSGLNLLNDPEFLGTGYEIHSSQIVDGEQVNSGYRKIVLYGDANGDGNICNARDIDVIRQDYVFGYNAEGVYKEAADLYRDGFLNVRDIQRMVKKYVGTLEGSLVTPFLGDGETIPDEEDDISIDIEPIENEDTFRISASSQSEEPIVSYSFVITKDGEPIYNTTTGSSQIRVSGLDEGLYIITVTGTTDTGKTLTGTAEFRIINPNNGETDDVNEAVAEILSTGKMYTSLQAALDAVEINDNKTDDYPYDDRVTLLKNVEDSIEIPEDKNIVIDLNTHTIIGEEGAEYTVKTSSKLRFINPNLSGITSSIIAPEGNSTNILVEGNGDLDLDLKVNCLVRTSGAVNVKNTGANNTITINGANLTIEGTGLMATIGIADLGTNSNILITRGVIDHYNAIKKTGENGKITIGVDGGEIHNDTTYLYIKGASCITANASTEVNFYDGYLKATYTDAITCLDPAKANAYNPLERCHPFDHTREDLGTDTIGIGGAGQDEAYYIERTHLGLNVYLHHIIDNTNKTVIATVIPYGEGINNITNIEWYYTIMSTNQTEKVAEMTEEFVFDNQNLQYTNEYSIYAVVTTDDGNTYETDPVYINVDQFGEVSEKHAMIKVESITNEGADVQVNLDGETNTITEVVWQYRLNYLGTGKTDRLGIRSFDTAATTSETMYKFTEEHLNGCYTGWYDVRAIIKEGEKVYATNTVPVYFRPTSEEQQGEAPDITLTTSTNEKKLSMNVTCNNDVTPIAYTYTFIKHEGEINRIVDMNTVQNIPDEITISEPGYYTVQLIVIADNGTETEVSDNFTISVSNPGNEG